MTASMTGSVERTLPERTLAALDRQEWIDPLAARLQEAVGRLLDGGGARSRAARNFLHGVWLGHPLHPVLVDLPIGAWSAALLLDLWDAASEGGPTSPVAHAADGIIALGVGASLLAAAAGLADWRHTSGRQRRMGFLHGVLNAGAVTLYGGALVLRRAGARRVGRVTAALGYALTVTAAYLGGHLVFAERLGVRHTADVPPPQEFVPVLPTQALVPGQPQRVEAGGFPVLLVRQGTRVFALADICTHLGCSLAEGRLEGETIVCPCHGSRYALADGRALEGPTAYPQTVLETRIHNGQVEVRRAE